MDIQKENDKYLVSLVTNCGATQDEINDLNFDDETGFFESNRLADWFINQINFGWRVWQAAKAQAVPEVVTIGNELQSWVAVHSFAAKDGNDIVCAVDANALAEEIEKLTGANA